MKTIRLQVAQRYLQRYTGAEIKCEHVGAFPCERPAVFVGNVRVADVRFIPEHTKVFLMRDGNAIAQITKKLPKASGYFDALTGEFQHEIPY